MSINHEDNQKALKARISFIEEYIRLYEKSRLAEVPKCPDDPAVQSATINVAIQNCMVALHHLTIALEILLPREEK